MTRKSLPSPSEIKRRATAWAHVAQLIVAGLQGKPFAWGKGEWQAYSIKARQMGFTLITKTEAKRRGYALREKAQPIGSAYFGSRRYGQVYILECHFKPLSSAKTGPVDRPTPSTTFTQETNA